MLNPQAPQGAQAAPRDPFLMLTPAGALRAHARAQPDKDGAELQTLMNGLGAPLRSAWLAESPARRALLTEALQKGWVQEMAHSLAAPNVSLDSYLPHAIAGLSGERMAALSSDEGFCLARVGYSEDEAETLCAAAVEFFDFAARQKQRGWRGGQAICMHEDLDMLMPRTTFMLFWVDGIGYWIIVGGEPLLNNNAFVELVWGLRAAGVRFRMKTERRPSILKGEVQDTHKPSILKGEVTLEQAPSILKGEVRIEQAPSILKGEVQDTHKPSILKGEVVLEQAPSILKGQA